MDVGDKIKITEICMKKEQLYNMNGYQYILKSLDMIGTIRKINKKEKSFEINFNDFEFILNIDNNENPVVKYKIHPRDKNLKYILNNI